MSVYKELWSKIRNFFRRVVRFYHEHICLGTLPAQKSAFGSQSSHLMRKLSFGRINRSFNVFMIKVVCCLMNRKMFMGKNLILDIARPAMSVSSPHVAVLCFASEAEQARPVTQNGIKNVRTWNYRSFSGKKDWVGCGGGGSGLMFMSFKVAIEARWVIFLSETCCILPRNW